jgi:pilus assembly protein CpaB
VRNWRVLTAIAAIVLAALAGVLVWKYTDNAKNDAKKPFTFTSALVAKSRVAASTSFDQALDSGLIAREQRVRNDVPASGIDASKTDAQLKSRYADLVAGHDIAEGQMIVDDDFVSLSAVSSGLAGQLETDQGKDKGKQLQAITLTLEDQRAVGGFLTPGDSVNVMVTISDDQDHWLNPEGNHVRYTSFLLAGVKVLAVGSTTGKPQQSATTPTSAQTTQSTISRNLITFEVTARQAQQLVQAEAGGTVYLSLNPESFNPDGFKDPGEVVEAVNLFDKPLPLLEQELKKLAGKSK